MLNKVPNLIEKKISNLYANEIEENRNQKYFLENLKDRMALELQKQRRHDYLKYKRQLNEVIQLKNNEEKEKMKLYQQIQKQKAMIRMQAIKFQNQFYQYQAYNIFPLYQFMQNQSNIINNANKTFGLDEIIKMFLFREIMRSFQRKKDFEATKSKHYKPLKKTYRKNSTLSSQSSSFRGKIFDKTSKKNSNNKASSNKKSTKKTTKSKGSGSSSSSPSKSSGTINAKSSDNESKSKKEDKKDDNDKKLEESKDDKKDDDKSEEKSDKDSKADDDEEGDEKDDTKNEGTNQNSPNQQSYQMPPSYQNPQNST
jgi:hypothetical protein